MVVPFDGPDLTQRPAAELPVRSDAGNHPGIVLAVARLNNWCPPRISCKRVRIDQERHSPPGR